MFLGARSFPHKKSHRHDRPYRREGEISDRYASAVQQAYGYDASLLGSRMDPRMEMFGAFGPLSTSRLQPELSGGLGHGSDRVGGLNVGGPRYDDGHRGFPPKIGSRREPLVREEGQRSGPDITSQSHRASKSDGRRGDLRDIAGTSNTEKHVRFHGLPTMSPIRGSGRDFGISLEESLQAVSLQDALFLHPPMGPSGYQLPSYHHLKRHPVPQSMAGHHVPEPHGHWPRPAQRHCVTHCRGYDEDDTKEHDCHAHFKTRLRPSSPIHHSPNPNSNSKRSPAADERKEHHRPSPIHHHPPSVEDYYAPLSSNEGLWYDPMMEGPFPGEGYWYEDALHGFYPR